jgi:hypothetical protein
MAEYFSLQSALGAVMLITALVTLLFIIPYRGGRTRCASIEVINMRVIIGAFLTVVGTILVVLVK